MSDGPVMGRVGLRAHGVLAFAALQPRSMTGLFLWVGRHGRTRNRTRYPWLGKESVLAGGQGYKSTAVYQG